MNLSSWQLFHEITNLQLFMAIVINMQVDMKFFEKSQMESVSEFNFKIMKDPQILSFYRNKIRPKERDLFNIADMSPFNKKHLKEALIDLSPYYEREINEEIDSMIKIIDATKSKHKTFATQQRIKMRLISHYSAY